MLKNIYHLLLLTFFLSACHQKTVSENTSINLDNFADGIHHWNLFTKNMNYQRFNPNNFEAIANNFLQYQNSDGGWPKNIDWLADLNADSVKASMSEHNRQSTFDNDNTWPQIDFLSKMYLKTGKKAYMESAEKGIQYILQAQDNSGGWRGWDVDAITYNDNVTTGIMNLLLDIKQGNPEYYWVSKKLKNQTNLALDRAIAATLKCQIEVNGVKKAWCQQHSHESYLPVKGRSFELPSVVTRESIDIIRFLMRLPKDSAIVESVNASILWLKNVQIHHLRIEDIPISPDTYPGQNLDIDRKAVVDSTAPPIWARFYEITDDTPFMCTRSGEKVFRLSDVNPERRGGYEWYGYWPADLLETAYPAWQKRE